ncbi:unnamed protein product, partial [Closterium sp. NIES-54]
MDGRLLLPYIRPSRRRCPSEGGANTSFPLTMVTTTTPGGQHVSICTCTRTGRHLATFTRRPGSSLYTLATEPPQVAASAQVSASSQVAASCSCRLLSHQTLLWHHCQAHPSLPRLRGMHSRLLVSGLPRSLPPLPPSPAPPYLPCVEGRQRATPHSSSFPPTSAPLQTLHMDVWGQARVSGQGRERYFLLVVGDYMRYTTVFPLRTKGGLPDVLITFLLQLLAEGILQSFTLPASPHQNGIVERRIGLVMEVAHTSMIHAVAPHFLWPFVVRYAAHQLNLWPRVSLPETSPTLRWTGKVGDASVFRCLFPYRSAPPPPPPLFLAPGPPPVDPLPPQGPAPSSVSQVDPLPGTTPVEVAGSGGAESGGAGSGGAEPGGAEPEGVEPGGAESEGAESGGAEPRGAASSRGPTCASPQLSSQQLCEWLVRRPHRRSGDTGAGVAAVTTGAGGTGGAAATGPGGARTSGAGAAETGGVGCAGAGDPTEPGAAGARGAGARGAGVGGPSAEGAGAAGAGVGGTRAEGAGAAGAEAVDPGAGGAGGTVRSRSYFVPMLQQVLGVPSSTGLPPPFLCPAPDQSQPPLQPASPLPAPSPYTEQSRGLTERREPASRPVSPVRTARRAPRSRPPPVPGTHTMALRPSSVPLRVPLPAPPESSRLEVPDPASDRAHAARPTVARLLASAVIDPSFESATASALVAELLDFAAACRLDYASALAAESVPASPPSVGGECALGTDVLEDGQEDFECLAAAVPRFASMLLAPEGDPDAPKIPTPRSYAEAITGPYSSQWQATMDAKMASWKSTGTYVDEVPLPGANIVDGMWIFRVKRLPGSPPAFKARYVARGFSHPGQSTAHHHTDLVTDGAPGPSALRLPVLLATAHSFVFQPLTLSSTFGRVRRAECTSGMGLVLGGRGPVVLTGHADASWVDDSATQRSSQGYTFSLGFGSVSWRSTHPSSVLSSSFEAKIYAGAMSAQELRWLTYLLTDLGEEPCSPPVLLAASRGPVAAKATDGGFVAAAAVAADLAVVKSAKAAEFERTPGCRRYVYHVEGGGQVTAYVVERNGCFDVLLDVAAAHMQCRHDLPLCIHWGIFRSDRSTWFLLNDSQTPPGTVFLRGKTDAMRTVLQEDSTPGHRSLVLSFDAELAPFSLNLVLFQPLAGVTGSGIGDKSLEGLWLRNSRQMDLCVPIGMGRGSASPLGATPNADGSVNFALYSRYAEGVVLCLYLPDDAEPTLEIDLEPSIHRTGDVWHVSIDAADVSSFTRYGYRVQGDPDWEGGNRFHSRLVLMDPYAKEMAAHVPGQEDLPSPAAALAVIPTMQEPPFDWQDDFPPNIPSEQLVVYRLNVAAFTADDSSGVSEAGRGTFQGVLEKVEHLLALGTRPQPRPPYPFRTASPSSTAVPLQPCASLLPFLSPLPQLQITDALHHWVEEYHVDGFSFINASALTTGPHAQPLSRPPLVEALAFDPLLAAVKLVADAAMPLLSAQKAFAFPHWKRWQEMNSAFCFDIRRFVSGQPGQISGLATRLCGSGDLFSSGRGPAYAFNYITAFQGLTLADLVSYSMDSEASWNCGVEGVSADEGVMRTRLKQVRNHLAVLFLSLGVPVLTAGDEYGHSKDAQLAADYSESPFLWSSLGSDLGVQLTRFIASLANFRRRRTLLLQRKDFYFGEDIVWHGAFPNQPEWDNPNCCFLACTVHSAGIESSAKEAAEEAGVPIATAAPAVTPSMPVGDLYFAFNAHANEMIVELPAPPVGMMWHLVLDTAKDYPADTTELPAQGMPQSITG